MQELGDSSSGSVSIEAARRLGLTANRVRALIEAKRLKAIKVGREWLIDPKDLDTVKNRKPGASEVA